MAGSFRRYCREPASLHRTLSIRLNGPTRSAETRSPAASRCERRVPASGVRRDSISSVVSSACCSWTAGFAASSRPQSSPPLWAYQPRRSTPAQGGLRPGPVCCRIRVRTGRQTTCSLWRPGCRHGWRYESGGPPTAEVVRSRRPGLRRKRTPRSADTLLRWKYR